MNRPILLLATLAVVASGITAFVSACTDNGSSPGGATTGDASSDASADGQRPLNEDGSTTEGDAAAEASLCELTRAYVTECNKDRPDGGEQLTCGSAKFDAWCASNDMVINSAAFRRGEASCLTQANCDPDKRSDCRYKTYASATPTAAQQQVAQAYCQTCEPADQTGCVTRKTTYKSALGPSSTDDVFVAAWELTDALDDEIRTKCTGAALDAGVSPDAGGCLKQFASCAGGIYIDHLPNCP